MNEPTHSPSQKSGSTPALQSLKDDLIKYHERMCYLVVSHDGHWGRGDTVEKAVQICISEGASGKTTASVLLILGDNTAEINKAGSIIRDDGSHRITVHQRIRLGALVRGKHKRSA